METEMRMKLTISIYDNIYDWGAVKDWRTHAYRRCDEQLVRFLFIFFNKCADDLHEFSVHFLRCDFMKWGPKFNQE